ncbi:MAG: F0F1 ATP synthase subunit B [Thermaerobacterales bacterium]
MEGMVLAAEIGIDPWDLMWAAINFVVFAAILARVLWRPVIDLLDQRRQEIETNLSHAEKSRAEAQQAQDEYRQRLAQAQREGQDVIEKATRTAEGQREEILRKAQSESEQLLERARNTIAQERDQAISELRREVADLTVFATERLLRRSLEGDDHRRLAEEILMEVGGQDHD